MAEWVCRHYYIYILIQQSYLCRLWAGLQFQYTYYIFLVLCSINQFLGTIIFADFEFVPTFRVFYTFAQSPQGNVLGSTAQLEGAQGTTPLPRRVLLISSDLQTSTRVSPIAFVGVGVKKHYLAIIRLMRFVTTVHHCGFQQLVSRFPGNPSPSTGITFCDVSPSTNATQVRHTPPPG